MKPAFNLFTSKPAPELSETIIGVLHKTASRGAPAPCSYLDV